jgi:hypothetical protein
VALLRLVVVHHHRVDAEHDHLRPGLLEPPEEELLQDPAKAPVLRSAEGPEEALHGVRGGQALRYGFDRAGVARVLLQRVEVDQVPARAVEEEAERLLEQLRGRQSLRVLANRAEHPPQFGENPDASQVAGEEGEARATRQPILRLSKPMNDCIARGAILRHIHPSPFGLSAAQAAC